MVLQNIETAYESGDFVQRVGSGLMKITYLVGDQNRGENPVEGDDTQDQDTDSGGTSPMTPLLFVVAGSAALVVVVSSVYMWRRFRGSSQDGMVTQFAGDSLETSKSGTTPRRPSSPDALSELIPGSYRLGDNTSILSNSNMSPVYELEDDSVVVSESGYSTEAGAADSESENATYVGLMSKYSTGGGSASTPDYLGARPMPGAIVGDLEDMEAPSDSDLDTSGETLSPVKMFVANNAVNNANMLDNGDVETPSSSSEDDALLFELDEDQEKEEEKKSEDISSGSPGGKSDINGSCAKSDINGSCAKSDIYTVFSPAAKDNNNYEESPLRGEDLEQQR